MMHYASQGVRNAARKGPSVLSHHNGPGGATTTSRSLHLSSNIWGPFRSLNTPINSLDAIRPRNPPHHLFTISKNFLQRLFTHLTEPGFRAPTYFAQSLHSSTRSLQSLRGNSIQSGLSFVTRASLRNNALHRQATMFLPRPPTPSLRCGGVANVGLETVRNFTTGRPIFQHVAENIPVAARALYEVDWDYEVKRKQARAHLRASKKSKVVQKPRERLQPNQNSTKFMGSIHLQAPKDQNASFKQEIDLYFPVARVQPVTTYLLIPLAPTPTSRMPLPPDPSATEPTLLPPLRYLASLHDSHSTQALRVSTLFTRLDQANVWTRGGVSCSAYSQRLRSKDESEGVRVCTILKVTFDGWTKAEVRGVIGESGTGWCVLEEVRRDQEAEDRLPHEDLLSSNGTTSPGISDASHLIDPAQSFVLPKLDFSSNFVSSQLHTFSPSSSFEELPSVEGIGNNQWKEEDFSSLSSGSSSCSDLSDLVEPPSINGWFEQSYALRPGISFSSWFSDVRDRLNSEPQEALFY